MKSTWRNLFRCLAAGGIAASTSAWSSALCYAQLAADYATDAKYASRSSQISEKSDGIAATATAENRSRRQP